MQFLHRMEIDSQISPIKPRNDPPKTNKKKLDCSFSDADVNPINISIAPAKDNNRESQTFHDWPDRFM